MKELKMFDKVGKDALNAVMGSWIGRVLVVWTLIEVLLLLCAVIFFWLALFDASYVSLARGAVALLVVSYAARMTVLINREIKRVADEKHMKLVAAAEKCHLSADQFALLEHELRSV